MVNSKALAQLCLLGLRFNVMLCILGVMCSNHFCATGFACGANFVTWVWLPHMCFGLPSYTQCNLQSVNNSAGRGLISFFLTEPSIPTSAVLVRRMCKLQSF